MADPIDKEDALGYQIHITANLLRNNFNDFLKPYGIYTEQYGVLCILNDQESLTLSQIADLVYKDKTSVTRLIDSLEKKEFVIKSPSATDRRAFDITISPKGKTLYEEIGLCLLEAKINIENQIDDKDKAVVLKVLKQLRTSNISAEVEQLKKENKC